MQYWLIKSDPDTYPFSLFLKEKTTFWDGVRNYQARNYLKAMKKGDLCLFYESVKEPMVMGVAEVSREHYPDPTTDETAWVAVDIRLKKALKRPVTLAEIKREPALSEMVLLKNSRLSVQPVEEEAFFRILEMGGIAR